MGATLLGPPPGCRNWPRYFFSLTVRFAIDLLPAESLAVTVILAVSRLCLRRPRRNALSVRFESRNLKLVTLRGINCRAGPCVRNGAPVRGM